LFSFSFLFFFAARMLARLPFLDTLSRFLLLTGLGISTDDQQYQDKNNQRGSHLQIFFQESAISLPGI
jgi:hypothetical protein